MKKYFDPLDCDWGRRGQLAFYGSFEFYGPGPGNFPLMDKIDRTCGPGWIWARPKPEKRPRSKVGIRRRAQEILGEISGFPYDWPLDAMPGKLGYRTEWLIEEIMRSDRGSYRRKFLVAVGRDAGVYPPPKWWRVTRRLQGKSKFSTRSRSAK